MTNHDQSERERTLNTAELELPGCNYPTLAPSIDIYFFLLCLLSSSCSLSSIKIIPIITGITDSEEYMQQEKLDKCAHLLCLCRTVVVDD